MTLSLAKAKINPPRILIYGSEGLGKTTFGTHANKPVFLPTENGLSAFPEIPQFPQAKSYDEVMSYLKEIRFNEHDYKTLVVDSLDWLEPLIWEKVCAQNNVKNIEDAAGGFGKGYNAAIDIWREYLDALDDINQNRDMTIIQIAHAQIKRYESPDIPAYDRFTIKLQDGKIVSAANKMFEYHDIVFFVNQFVGITKDKLPGSTNKNPKERVRGIGSGERILYTEERPAYKAKNRFGLPEQIPFDADGQYWNTIADSVPYYKKSMGV